VAELVPSCVWAASDDLLLALDAAFGEPDDAYVNGAQVWIRDDGPGGAALEWRLHPVPGFQRPDGVATHELLETVVYAIRAGEAPPRPVAELWNIRPSRGSAGEGDSPSRSAMSQAIFQHRVAGGRGCHGEACS